MVAMLNMTDNWLNITRVEMEVYVDNAPAIALYKKFGFVIEGTRPMFAFREGGYADAHMMGRLKVALPEPQNWPGPARPAL